MKFGVKLLHLLLLLLLDIPIDNHLFLFLMGPMVMTADERMCEKEITKRFKLFFLRRTWNINKSNNKRRKKKMPKNESRIYDLDSRPLWAMSMFFFIFFLFSSVRTQDSKVHSVDLHRRLYFFLPLFHSVFIFLCLHSQLVRIFSDRFVSEWMV